MDHVKHLREQAERCFELARDVTSQELRTQLEIFGREYAEHANNIEGEQAAAETTRGVLPGTRPTSSGDAPRYDSVRGGPRARPT
jgi:hypothetical protein